MTNNYDLGDKPSFEIARVTPTQVAALPEDYTQRIVIITLHDGGGIPEEFLNCRIDNKLLRKRYLERDWGANLIAKFLAQALGLEGYARINIARVLLDFNRFPGTTPPGTRDPLERLSIHTPFAETLDHAAKTLLLERYYDAISLQMEQACADKHLMLCVHTYDEHNPSLTRRPDLSLITRAACYQHDARMPFALFDPMYPDVLGESSCSRVLRDRISLNLERSGFRVSHNHPYPLPVGSLEVRSQVWYFFRYLRERFEQAHPASIDLAPYHMVWTMLLNTNLRLQEAETLKGYLHRYHRVEGEDLDRLRAAQRAYSEIWSFAHQTEVVADYRRSIDRPSSLSLEVRKDLLCHFDSKTGEPLARTRQMEQRATEIAQVIAGGIRTFLDTDRDASSKTRRWRASQASPDDS